MTSMEDLIATISGGMHVSQEGYDLKALQEYLSRTIVLPNVVSPGGTYGYAPGPSSRATSMTRKQIPQGGLNSHPGDTSAFYGGEYTDGSMGMYQPYPSPIATVAEDPLPQPHRPASLRRSSSYGFGSMAGPSSPYMEYSSFDGDAFAPLAEANERGANVWSNGTAAAANTGAGGAAAAERSGKPNPWTAYQAGGVFGNQWAGKSVWDTARAPALGHSGYRPPTPPDEDDEMMDEDQVDSEIDEGGAQPGVGAQQQPAQTAQATQIGMPGVDERIANQGQNWERGRRKQ